MSKPIKLTEELLDKIQKEFIEKVKTVKMFDGKLEYSRTFKWDGDDDRATIYMSSVAFAKMNALIQQFNDEIAWHGVAHRDENNPSVFHITDILVYPQVVTGTTVNTDQDAYQTWLYSFDDDVFNNIRMQGHSHVNMGVSPSGVDTSHQEKILEQISDDDYYIFMIWNKKYEHFVRIFDLKNNTLYETADVDVFIGDTGVDLPAFINGAKEIVTKRTYASQANPTYPSIYQGTYQGGYQGGYQQGRITPITPAVSAPAVTAPAAAPVNSGPVGVKTKPKDKGGSDIGRSFQNYSGARGAFDQDDDDDYSGMYLGR